MSEHLVVDCMLTYKFVIMECEEVDLWKNCCRWVTHVRSSAREVPSVGGHALPCSNTPLIGMWAAGQCE